MNSDEAKFILQARRPHGADDQTPAMRAALEQATRDPVLGDWLSAEERFDTTVANALRRVGPPADLRTLILAGAAAQTPSNADRAWWRRAPWLGLAASLALIATLGTVAWVRLVPSAASLARQTENLPANLATLTHVALTESVVRHGKAVHADDVGELGRWLETPGQRLTVGLPADFAGLRALGCRTLTVAGHEVLEVCFKRDQVYHLYIARRSDFAPDADHGMQIETQSGLTIARWVQGELVHVLATKGDPTALNAVL